MEALRRSSPSPPSPPPASAQVSPSIVVIIIVLTIIFFLSAFLHLLIRWLARGQMYRGGGGRRRRRAAAEEDGGGGGGGNRIVTLTVLQGQLQQLFSMQDAGLERGMIEEMPVFLYKAVMAELKEGADCAICLSEFQAEDELRLLPSCAHAFHTLCIDTWLLSHSTCPLCRISLLPDAAASSPWLLRHRHHIHPHPPPPPPPPPPLLRLFPPPSPPDSAPLLHLSHPSPSFPSPLHPTPPFPLHSCPTSSFPPPPSISALDREPFASSFRQSTSDDALFPNDSSSAKSATQDTVATSTAAAESGRLSYMSLCDRSVAGLSESGRASSYGGSGRRMSVQLGRCKFVKNGGAGGSSNNSIFFKSRGSRRSFRSRGTFEYVVDGTSRIEIFVPDHNPDDDVKNGRFVEGEAKAMGANRIPSSVSDRSRGVDQDLRSTSARTDVGIHGAPYPTVLVSEFGHGVPAAEDSSKRAVSFRLPHPPGTAKLKASASRRSLSDSEAFAFWESAAGTGGGDERRLVLEGQRSSSFARRTVEWVMRWQRRMVHPDGSNSIMGCAA